MSGEPSTQSNDERKKRPQSPDILSISQTRALAQQHSILDVAIASISGQTIDPREAAAVSSGAAFDEVDGESIGSELETRGACCA